MSPTRWDRKYPFAHSAMDRQYKLTELKFIKAGSF